MAFPLQQVLRALLFSSQQPLSTEEIQATFARFHEQPLLSEAPAQGAALPAGGAEEEPAGPGEFSELYSDVPSLVTAAQIREAMESIAAEIGAADTGLLLVEGPGGFRLATDPKYARWIRLLRQEPPPARLGASALETLAVVAYRQPVTRMEIEAIRGVSAEAGLGRLIERELVRVAGRADQPGRPLQYETTEKFLEFVGVKSLDELPASDVLTSRQIDDWLRQASEPRKPGDLEMGLADESAAPANRG